jgi:hypothetical protein
MTQDEWIIYGVEHGYCSHPVCDTHDGVPLTEEEEAEYEDGGDPCIHVVRLLVL